MRTRPSRKFNRMCEVYKMFVDSYGFDAIFDWSEEAKLKAFNIETYGLSAENDRENGYCYAKHVIDLTVKMWREDILKGLLFKRELYQDAKFPHWWLNKVLKGMPGACEIK